MQWMRHQSRLLRALWCIVALSLFVGSGAVPMGTAWANAPQPANTDAGPSDLPQALQFVCVYANDTQSGDHASDAAGLAGHCGFCLQASTHLAVVPPSPVQPVAVRYAGTYAWAVPDENHHAAGPCHLWQGRAPPIFI